MTSFYSLTEEASDIITEEASADTTNEVMGSIQESVEKTSGLLNDALGYIQKALPTVIIALVILIVGILISKLIAKIVGKAVSKSNVNGSAKSFLVSLIKIILYIAVIIMALSVLNVPMSSIITILGAAGLAISLALQSCLSNLSGGFIILFTKPFTAGDIIELDETVGTVRDIGIFYTKIVTFDNKTVFIPNGKVTDAKIVNYTETPTRRIDLKFDISYSADFGRAREVILEIISNEKLILKAPEPIVRMSAHNSSSISIDVLVWVNNADYLTERYNMTEAVKAAFDENGIEIPFPQLDIHVKDKV
ncbi:mechanosensitive ion channel family protein [Ruminococcus flavefaciens]|uniref:Small conductance mechanosensitive channel n=1 Tax=Ruminococcus flavefaciens TaxID=1265 RepID=A0A1K1Q3W0_RUMFL|nr:mechanosensitive ion channel domain-containing protein [Ruminococcus flavefaciens]SFW54421.1 small conductance mechanosensitive channel [Ruminococcus flavefaciens]